MTKNRKGMNVMYKTRLTQEELNRCTALCREHSTIPKELYSEYNVYKGLRDTQGNGVRSGLTKISKITAKREENGVLLPADGKLFYRGINISDLTSDFIRTGRFGFEETAYLLLLGELPNKEQLEHFKDMLNRSRYLPRHFTRDVIMKATNADMMNSLAKSILTLASYDENALDTSLENVLSQCIHLISVFPMLSVYGYQAYNYYGKGKSLYLHNPKKELSQAENILRMLRPDKKYTSLEAHVLDLALILHMEHGGGNNSSFTTHVVSSSGTDTYSAIAAALCSLKGPKHGGANQRVVEMMDDLRHNVRDIEDCDEIEDYLTKILRKETFDRLGLIYGMGHAVYSISDPRAQILKMFVEQLAKEKGKIREYNLYSTVEDLAPKVIAKERKVYKGVSANVDFYSGFVYNMLGIPKELFTPMFAIARIVGWSAHRIEELINVNKIIRPEYTSVAQEQEYIPMDKRQ